MSDRAARKKRIVRFLFAPVVFLFLGYFAVFLMAYPFLHSFVSTTNLMFFDKKADGGSQVGSIFTAAPETNQKTVKLSSVKFPEYGTKFGQLSIASASIKADLYFGDDSEELRKGVGLYNGSFVPGYGKTILIAGHNHTFFHTLGNIKTGEEINIDTNYGKYVYKAAKTRICQASDQSAYDLNSEKENLILYTCYPFNCIGLTSQRYYVYAEYVSGPKIEKQG